MRPLRHAEGKVSISIEVTAGIYSYSIGWSKAAMREDILLVVSLLLLFNITVPLANGDQDLAFGSVCGDLDLILTVSAVSTHAHTMVTTSRQDELQAWDSADPYDYRSV